MHYKNFKTVTYCVAGWVNHITEEELREQADFLQKYRQNLSGNLPRRVCKKRTSGYV